nr:exonuclease 1 [Tanacetum cinerariifolium]
LKRVALEQAHDFDKRGDSVQSKKKYRNAFSITTEDGHNLIQRLKEENFKFVVSPYEADAQIAYLCNKRIVDTVIGQDSDFVVYGCDDVIYKLHHNGSCKVYNFKTLLDGRYKLKQFSKDMLIRLGVLLGCDYTKHRVGFRRARDLVLEHKDHSKAIAHLRATNPNIPGSYEQSYKKAVMTFKHHVVYDPELETATYVHEFMTLTLFLNYVNDVFK